MNRFLAWVQNCLVFSQSTHKIQDVCFNCLNPLHPGPCAGWKEPIKKQNIDKVKQSLDGVKLPSNLETFKQDLQKLTKPQLKEVAKDLELKLKGTKAEHFDALVSKVREKVQLSTHKEIPNVPADQPTRTSPVGSVQKQPPTVGGPVENPPTKSIDPGVSQTGAADRKPIGDRPTDRVPAEISKVNQRLDRVQQLFHSKGEHQIEDWVGKLKDHVNSVGVEAALESLSVPGAQIKDSSQGKKLKVEYEGGWDKAAFDQNDAGYHLSAFCERYLNRSGVVMTHQLNAKGDSPLISSMSPDYGGSQTGPKGSFLPQDPKLKNKLEEAKHLPGLETSEDLGVLYGSKVTHLSGEVTSKLDDKYGKDQWIVKAYGDEAAAGYGIFSPREQSRFSRRPRKRSGTVEVI